MVPDPVLSRLGAFRAHAATRARAASSSLVVVVLVAGADGCVGDRARTQSVPLVGGACGAAIAPRLAIPPSAVSELDDECSLLWVRKGKGFSLGTYAPDAADLVDVGDGHLLRRRAAEAFRALQAEAKRAGHAIVAVSGYRDHEQQARTHALWIDRHRAHSAGTHSEEDLERQVGEFSAKSGHSEHQLGTTVDVSAPGTQPFNRAHAPSAFSTSCAGKWVRDNAHRFGFTLSYPYGRELLTCFNPEPWHFRYVGVALATELASRGSMLEEHFRASFPKVAVPSTLLCPPTRPGLDYERLGPKDCDEGRRDRSPSRATE